MVNAANRRLCLGSVDTETSHVLLVCAQYAGLQPEVQRLLEAHAAELRRLRQSQAEKVEEITQKLKQEHMVRLFLHTADH